RGKNAHAGSIAASSPAIKKAKPKKNRAAPTDHREGDGTSRIRRKKAPSSQRTPKCRVAAEETGISTTEATEAASSHPSSSFPEESPSSRGKRENHPVNCRMINARMERKAATPGATPQSPLPFSHSMLPSSFSYQPPQKQKADPKVG